MNFIDRITDGLKLYEVIVLLFGSLFFIVLLVLLVVFVIQKRRLKQLLIFFGLSILMLVWPSLQKIKIDKLGVELETKSQELAKNPTAEKAKEVEMIVDKLKNRGVENSEVRKNIAIAEFLIGKPEDSKASIAALPDKEKNDKAIIDIGTSIRVSEELKTQLIAVQKTPNDSTEVKRLNFLQNEAVKLEVKNYQIDSGIKDANLKIQEFKRENPKVEMQRYYVRPTN